MKRLLAILSLLAAPALLQAQDEEKGEPPKQAMVGYKDYLGLLGQDYSGNVFVIRYNGRLVAVMSKHQFGDGTVPSQAEDLDTDKPVKLDSKRKFEQEDVMIIPLQNQEEKVQFLDFDPDFKLKEGDKLWITRGGTKESRGTTGKLIGIGLKDGEFVSTEKPRELTFILDKPADVRGGSGHEVIHVQSGKPIGVLVAANIGGKDATRVVFEPICLPIPKGKAEKQNRVPGSN